MSSPVFRGKPVSLSVSAIAWPGSSRLRPVPSLAWRHGASCRRAATSSSLGAGEPDFDTPEHIKCRGESPPSSRVRPKYTPIDGTTVAQDRDLPNKFERDNGLEYAPQQVLVSAGGKQSLFNLCLGAALARATRHHPGTLLGLVPRHGARLADANPVYHRIGHRKDFKITPRASRRPRLRTHSTRMFINSPSNPTGRQSTRGPNFRPSARSSLRHPESRRRRRTTCTNTSTGPTSRSRELCDAACPDLLIGSDGHHQRRLESLRHDRLADRLLRQVPVEIIKAMKTDPEPEHVEPLQHFAGCSEVGPDWRSGALSPDELCKAIGNGMTSSSRR